MPVGLGIATVGSSLIGGIASNSAAKKAAQASQDATNATLQANREALATQQANTAVARGVGDSALSQLGQRTGATTPSVRAGDPNWAAYTQANPDLVQYYTANQNSPQALAAWGLQPGATLEQFAQAHYSRNGQQEGRQLPTYTADQATQSQPRTDVQLSQQAQVQNYTRPADTQQAPSAYTPTQYATPTFQRPDYEPQLDVSYNAFQNSADARAATYDIAQQSRAAQAALNASGAIGTGAALKRLQEIGQDNQVKYFNQFRDYTTGQYNTDRARTDANFNFDTNLAAQQGLAYAGLNSGNNQFAAGLNRSDYQYAQNRQDNLFNTDRAYGTDLALANRGYETGRYDTQTNNLFNLANLGQGAAAQTNAAIQNANATNSNALFSNAAAQGNAALTGAANLNNLLQTGVNAFAYGVGNRAAPYNPGQSAYLYGAY